METRTWARGPSSKKGGDGGSPLRPGANGKRRQIQPEAQQRGGGPQGMGIGRGSCSLLPCAGWETRIRESLWRRAPRASPTNDHSASCPPTPPRRLAESRHGVGWRGKRLDFAPLSSNFLFNVHTAPLWERSTSQAINCDYGASGRLRVLGTRRTRASRSDTGRPDRSRSRLGAYRAVGAARRFSRRGTRAPGSARLRRRFQRAFVSGWDVGTLIFPTCLRRVFTSKIPAS